MDIKDQMNNIEIGGGEGNSMIREHRGSYIRNYSNNESQLMKKQNVRTFILLLL